MQELPKPSPLDPDAAVTVFYDGQCPVCTREIAYYQGQSGGEQMSWVDATDAGALALEAPTLTQHDALARFHVRRADGTMVSGARAFASLWMALPKMRWLGKLASLPGVISVVELGYRITLRVRPALQRFFR
ncbi:MAG: DUF393 domain-containing protein [Pseudomonadota bacterium]